MAKASDIKNGNILRFNGELVAVEEFIHRTPGNLRPFYQARMRNVRSGKLVEYRFRTDEEVDIMAQMPASVEVEISYTDKVKVDTRTGDDIERVK